MRSRAKVRLERSYSVVNSAEVPTSAFILNPDAKFPSAEMQQAVRTEVGDDRSHFIDASTIASQLLGDSIASNLFLLGFAYQNGLVPVSWQALERAIELNAVAVDFNKQAFLWGRRCAHQPERVMELVKPKQEPPQLSLVELIDDRVRRLAQYQNDSYAAGFREFVEQVQRSDPNTEKGFTRAVARSLYKLMAYKDEYEVARLYSDGEFRRKLEQQFEGNYKLSFHLAPPLLSRRDPQTGRLLKREFPSWTLQLFGLLARLRFLRGSALDIFGHTEERKQERADIKDYRDLVQGLLGSLEDSNYSIAIQLAEMSMQLRGFGHVKDGNRDKLASQREELLAQFRGENVVKFVERVA
jgi:indolepyruvate ferredoxin oxidoreductase